MLFDRYISQNIRYEPFITDRPDENLGIVVVIPVCREPELLDTINSLSCCDVPDCGVEVIVVVNESETSAEDVRLQNDRTLTELADWKLEQSNLFFRLHAIRPAPFPKKHAGAGLARKTGMDEAIRRFRAVDKENGILVSLDADTLVDRNYLTVIEKAFASSEKAIGLTIRFQHRQEEVTDERHRRGMELYEKYLHYYKQALEFTGFPHAIYTIGSAFAVRTAAYVKQGGMSKRQAGEDFYFLHKLTALGKVIELNSTCVYPSARLSDRVPFGTGPALKKWHDGDNQLQETYSFSAFVDLKTFFDDLPGLYEMDWKDGESADLRVPHPLMEFLVADGFAGSLSEIKKNSSTYPAFEKRFFQYFNAFKILKFLNYSHPDFYAFQDLEEACDLLQTASI